MAEYKAICGRCLGSGRYDRGACFGCAGRGYKLTSRKPWPRFTVSAIYLEDGVRRVIRTRSAPTAEKAVEKALADRDWSPWYDLNTVEARPVTIT
jgi:hypothetical protein